MRSVQYPGARLVGIGLAAAAVIAVAVWQLRGPSPPTASVPTATAVGGDVLVSVRALGKVVDARAASRGISGSGRAPAAPAVTATAQLIFPEAAGRVTTLLVSPGQHVGAGQSLARLDPANARGNLVAAQASLDQAMAQLEVDRSGVTPQTLAPAKAAVTTADATLTGGGAALRHAVSVNRDAVAGAAQQVVQAKAQLTADLAMPGPNPQATVVAEAAVQAARDGLASDQQLVVKDQGAGQSATDALAQTWANAAQSEHQARTQVTAAAGSLKSARDQLSALRRADGQAVTKDRQALAMARSALAQARSKAAESTSQMQGQLTAASVGLANAQAASVALEQGAPGSLLAQDRSKILAARAQVDLARSGLAQTVVRAPSRGTVTGVFVAAGTPVDASTPIVAMADLAHLAVGLDLSEFDAARVRAGLSADVRVDALGGKRFPGRVVSEAISGVDNGGVVTFPVRVALGRAPGVRIGMNVSARIIVARRRGVVTVPLEALSRDDRGRPVVTVVRRSGRTSSRVVSLGLANNKDVEITRGLRAGERVELQSSQGS